VIIGAGDAGKHPRRVVHFEDHDGEIAGGGPLQEPTLDVDSEPAARRLELERPLYCEALMSGSKRLG